MQKIALLALLALPLGARAQVIDQYQPFGPGIFGNAGWWQAQTFTPSVATSIGGGFQLYHLPESTETDPVEIRLYDGAANAGGTLLASGTVQATYVGHAPLWVDVFWSPVGVTVGQTYWLYVRDKAADLPSVATTYALNAYPGGRVNYTNSADITAPFIGDSFYAYDLSFRTWAPTPPPPPTPPFTSVPEPSSLALIALALGMVGLVALRRQQQGRFLPDAPEP